MSRPMTVAATPATRPASSSVASGAGTAAAMRDSSHSSPPAYLPKAHGGGVNCPPPPLQPPAYLPKAQAPVCGGAGPGGMLGSHGGIAALSRQPPPHVQLLGSQRGKDSCRVALSPQGDIKATYLSSRTGGKGQLQGGPIPSASRPRMRHLMSCSHQQAPGHSASFCPAPAAAGEHRISTGVSRPSQQAAAGAPLTSTGRRTASSPQPPLPPPCEASRRGRVAAAKWGRARRGEWAGGDSRIEPERGGGGGADSLMTPSTGVGRLRTRRGEGGGWRTHEPRTKGWGRGGGARTR